MGWHSSEDRFPGEDQSFPGFLCPSLWSLSRLLLLQTLLAFAWLLWKRELVVVGEMCMFVSPGERGCRGVVGSGWEQPKMVTPGSAPGDLALLSALSREL